MLLKVSLANIITIGLMGMLGYALLLGLSQLRSKYGAQS